MPTDSTDEQQLSRLFAALANPVVRHFVELLILERRTPVEASKHFDLSPTDIRRLGEDLRELGLITNKYDGGYVFADEGLTPLQCWLDRIRSLKRPTPG
jgi:DNA-binding transcriptional ArsR family regulator